MRTTAATLLLLAVAAAQAAAQNDLNTFTTACQGRGGTVRQSGSSLVCDTPTGQGSSGSSLLATAWQIGQTIGALLEEEAKRAAVREANRRIAIDLLGQHQNAAMQRQDAARAALLRSIQERLARSDLAFKGMTGAGSQLGVKLDGSGGIGFKLGDSATQSLRAPAAPVSQPAAPADDDQLLALIAQLPASEQQALLDELRARIAGTPAPPPIVEPGERLRDAPTSASALAFKLPALPPPLDPNASPEEAKAFGDLDFANRGATTISIGSLSVPSPPAGAAAAPAAVAPGVPQPPDPPADPCQSLQNTAIVGLCQTGSDIVDPARLRPNAIRAARSEVASSLPATRYWESVGNLIETGTVLTAGQRIGLLDNEGRLFARYQEDRAFAALVDARLDEQVRLAQALLRNLNAAAWSRSLRNIEELVERFSSGRPVSPQALMANPEFADAYKAFSERLVDERRQNETLAAAELGRSIRRALDALK